MGRTITLRFALFLFIPIAVILQLFQSRSGSRLTEAVSLVESHGNTVISESSVNGLIYNVYLLNKDTCDRDIELLHWIPRISTLSMRRLGLSNAQIDRVSQNNGIQKLILWHNRDVSDGAMRNICNIGSLEHLDISDTSVTAAGLVDLWRLRSLTELNVSHTKIDDCGCEHISKCVAVTTLDLSYTRISDAGVLKLRSLTRLIELRLTGVAVSADSLAALTRSNPNVVVVRRE